MSVFGDSDRSHPEWAKPLAPLPEWLASAEEILREARLGRRPPESDEAQRYADRVLALLSDEQEYGDYGWATSRQAEWLKEWRRRLRLSTARAARVLGYENAAAIETIENGRSLRRVRRDPVRQRRLAEERWGEAIHDRVEWLKGWRKWLGITQREASQILGYSHQNEISRVERRHYQPAWEKILVAIVELDHRSLGRDFRRTEQPR